MTRRVGRLAAVAALAALGACSEGRIGGRGEGVVRATHDDGRIVIEHGDIPGVMKAMTMEFEVDPGLLKGIESGDRVTFAIEAEGGRYHVTQLSETPGG
jgi:Cu/Ag efflux protein CusF